MTPIEHGALQNVRSSGSDPRLFFAQQIAGELEQMGYSTKIISGPGLPDKQLVVVFKYYADCGKYAGKQFLLGVSMRGGLPYPEYPPHWVHIHPPYRDRHEGAHEYADGDGRGWMAMSRPPRKLWDELSKKSMEPYMNLHIRKIFHNLQ